MTKDTSENLIKRETNIEEIYRRLVESLKQLDLNQFVPSVFNPDDSELIEIPAKHAVRFRIKSQSKLVVSVTLSIAGNSGQTLYVENYSSPIVGKGLGTAFYKNLDQFAADQGFQTIVGGNGKDNITFFTDKLGRKRLSDLSPQERQALIGEEIEDGSLFTFKRLEVDSSTKRS